MNKKKVISSLVALASVLTVPLATFATPVQVYVGNKPFKVIDIATDPAIKAQFASELATGLGNGLFVGDSNGKIVNVLNWKSSGGLTYDQYLANTTDSLPSKSIKSATPLVQFVTVTSSVDTVDTLKTALGTVVNVTYDDNTTGKAAVVWNVSNVDLSKVGAVTVTGTVTGTTLTVTNTVIVAAKQAEKTIIYVTPIKSEVQIKQGESVDKLKEALGTTATAHYSDGTTDSSVSVTWDLSTIDLSKKGTYTVNGTVAGYATPVKVNVNVKSDYVFVMTVDDSEITSDGADNATITVEVYKNVVYNEDGSFKTGTIATDYNGSVKFNSLMGASFAKEILSFDQGKVVNKITSISSAYSILDTIRIAVFDSTLKDTISTEAIGTDGKTVLNIKYVPPTTDQPTEDYTSLNVKVAYAESDKASDIYVTLGNGEKDTYDFTSDDFATTLRSAFKNYLAGYIATQRNAAVLVNNTNLVAYYDSLIAKYGLPTYDPTKAELPISAVDNDTRIDGVYKIPVDIRPAKDASGNVIKNVFDIVFAEGVYNNAGTSADRSFSRLADNSEVSLNLNTDGYFYFTNTPKQHISIDTIDVNGDKTTVESLDSTTDFNLTDPTAPQAMGIVPDPATPTEANYGTIIAEFSEPVSALDDDDILKVALKPENWVLNGHMLTNADIAWDKASDGSYIVGQGGITIGGYTSKVTSPKAEDVAAENRRFVTIKLRLPGYTGTLTDKWDGTALPYYNVGVNANLLQAFNCIDYAGKTDVTGQNKAVTQEFVFTKVKPAGPVAPPAPTTIAKSIVVWTDAHDNIDDYDPTDVNKTPAADDNKASYDEIHVQYGTVMTNDVLKTTKYTVNGKIVPAGANITSSVEKYAYDYNHDGILQDNERNLSGTRVTIIAPKDFIGDTTEKVYTTDVVNSIVNGTAVQNTPYNTTTSASLDLYQNQNNYDIKEIPDGSGQVAGNKKLTNILNIDKTLKDASGSALILDEPNFIAGSTPIEVELTYYAGKKQYYKDPNDSTVSYTVASEFYNPTVGHGFIYDTHVYDVVATALDNIERELRLSLAKSTLGTTFNTGTATTIALPTTLDGGTIGWASNNAAINATTGAITRPVGADATVTLTGTVTYAATPRIVTFTVTVPQQ